MANPCPRKVLVSTRSWAWSLVTTPTRLPRAWYIRASRARVVVFPDPRNPPTMTNRTAIGVAP